MRTKARDQLLHSAGINWLECNPGKRALFYSLLPQGAVVYGNVSPRERNKMPSLRTVERFLRFLDNACPEELNLEFSVRRGFGGGKVVRVLAHDILRKYRAQRKTLARRQFNPYCNKARIRVSRLSDGSVLRVDTGQLCFLKWLVQTGYVDAVSQWAGSPHSIRAPHSKEVSMDKPHKSLCS